MIAPAALADLVAATRITATRDTIVAQLARLLPGVTVAGHAGKLDINDVVESDSVRTPGILVGYTRVRELADPGGTFTVAVDWVAYIAVDDWVLATATPPRAVKREDVAHAIGLQLLRILRDPDSGTWGLGAIEVPAMDPPPAFVPMFTLKTAKQATALYAVTWSQGLIQEGARFFGGATPAGDIPGWPTPDGSDDVVVFDLPEGSENDYPPELLAAIRRGGSPGGDGP